MEDPAPEPRDLLLDAISTDRVEAERKLAECMARIATYARMKGCADYADDLVQETVASALKNLTSGVIVEKGEAYLARIAHNLLVKFWNHRAKTSQLDTDVAEAIPEHNPGEDGEDEEGEMAEMRNLQRTCLAKLKPEHRNLVLKYFPLGEDEKAKQVRADMAARLGITVGDLRVRVCRIRKRLEDCVYASRDAESINRWKRIRSRGTRRQDQL